MSTLIYMSLLHLVTALAVIVVVVAASSAGTQNEPMKKKPIIGSALQEYLLQQQQQADGRKLKPFEPARLVVHYHDNFPDELKSVGNLGVDIKPLNFAVFETTDVYTVLGNENFIAVDIDQIVSIGHHTEEVEEGEGDEITTKAGLRGRQLEEVGPYGLRMVQADQFDDIKRDAETVLVCVIDTGYENGHRDLPELQNNDGWDPNPADYCYFPEGSDQLNCDYYTGQKWDDDGNSHGTHVAGTIGAIGGNDEGVPSVLSFAGNEYEERFKFFIAKPLADHGNGFTSAVVEAAEECKKHADEFNFRNVVVNLSLGGGTYSEVFENAFEKLYDEGLLMIAAAGNTGSSNPHYPGSYRSLMAVANVDGNMSRYRSSTRHDQVEISAPGYKILSTIPNGYAVKTGTSMASPHVTGVAALIWSYFPECSNVEIRNALLRTAVDQASCDNLRGHGVVQARAAYELLLEEGCTGGSGVRPSAVSPGGCDQLLGADGMPDDFENDPTLSPTPSPTQSPTQTPTKSPTASPTSGPTTSPTSSPTKSPTPPPTRSPTVSPTPEPTKAHKKTPTTSPTATPTKSPTSSPTTSPTATPTKSPTESPTFSPGPTTSPTSLPTKSPTAPPTRSPTVSPTSSPTKAPTKSPTASPTKSPTESPTLSPGPTTSPTSSPTKSPTTPPTRSPTVSPTSSPTKAPTKSPTASPTKSPTISPTASPTRTPTILPTKSPTESPTASPTAPPTNLQIVDTGGIGLFSLGECQSDCDDDDDCFFGLICHQRDPGEGDVPGCTGDADQVPGAAGFEDYCVKPPEGTLVIMANRGTIGSPDDEAFPLGNCQGDCDSDEDCDDGLDCFHRIDSTDISSVPGCNGSGDSGWDYCYVP